jgi:hypothetical protein
MRFEHSWGDGVAIMRLCDEMCKDSRENAWVDKDSVYVGDVNPR